MKNDNKNNNAADNDDYSDMYKEETQVQAHTMEDLYSK